MRPATTPSAGDLVIVMYHYVRDVAGTRFPGLKALGVDAFRAQVQALSAQCELATVESTLDFLDGRYAPSRPLCLLTFDDGVAEHAGVVTDVLADVGAAGIFSVVTDCVDRREMIPTHKLHLVLAAADTRSIADALATELAARTIVIENGAIDDSARNTYRWDDHATARVKWLANYGIPLSVRGEVIDALFARFVGDVREVANDFYLSWDDARAMEGAGMVIGGHTKTHPVLARSGAERDEIVGCAIRLREELGDARRPFAYPFGKRETFTDAAVSALEDAGFSCAFTTEVGFATGGDARYLLPRIDTKDVTWSP